MEIQPWFSIIEAHVRAPVEFPWFERPSCWETQAEILLNRALRSQTQNNLQHTDKNNDPSAVVKLETIP